MAANLSDFAAALVQIAHDAGQLVLTHYAGVISARSKSDSSPVTLADEEAEALIEQRLGILAPNIPVVAEEAMAAGRRPEIGKTFFLVDPLDGTKEFLQRNGEFTVNIALIEDGNPVCGIVHAPALARAFLGDSRDGMGQALEIPAPPGMPLDLSAARTIRARRAPPDGMVAVVSRTHRDSKTEEYLAQYGISRLVAAGSSLKFCLVATGEADLYPRHGRTMEWDTAAGHAVLAAAGGSVTQLDGTRFFYGKVAQDFANPYFLARGRP